MHMDMSGKPFHARIYRKHAAPQDRDAEFVRACTVEMHMGILEEPFYPRIYRRNATPQKLAARFVRRSRNAHWHVTGAISCKNLQEKSRDQSAYPDLTPALTPTARTPQCTDTVWGIQPLRMMDRSRTWCLSPQNVHQYPLDDQRAAEPPVASCSAFSELSEAWNARLAQPAASVGAKGRRCFGRGRPWYSSGGRVDVSLYLFMYMYIYICSYSYIYIISTYR